MSGAMIERVRTALAVHDECMAYCPVNNPKHGQVFAPQDKCPRCGATASGSCGLASGAGYHLARDIRAALSENEGEA